MKLVLVEEASESMRNRPVIATDSKTGLPLILGGKPATVDEEITPERAAEILLAQDVEWHQML